MRWRKLGRIFVAPGRPSWMRSHAAVPLAVKVQGERYRVFFSSRDRRNRSHTGWFEINLVEPLRILKVCRAPVLRPGSDGLFDDAGATGCWLVARGRRRDLYYVGWSSGGRVPFRNALGLAVSRDGGRRFRRESGGPVLDRSWEAPAFVGSACVLRAGRRWRMWYTAGLGWDRVRGRMRPRYLIKHAESSDGASWRPTGGVCIGFARPGEHAITRPCVVRDGGLYRMWYSYRGVAYRIGYAESRDGLAWVRKDGQVGIAPSRSGWDSEMIEYPFVFDYDGRRYMLYNGNGYGKTGVGLAVLEP